MKHFKVPKAAPRKQSRKDEKENNVEWTDEEHRDDVARRKIEKQSKEQKPTKKATPKPVPTKRSMRSKSTSVVRHVSSSSDSDEDISKFCCVCSEPVQQTSDIQKCIECKRFAHGYCVKTSDDTFMCNNCYSDLSTSKASD